MNIKEQFGQKIRNLRKEKGLSQEAFARLCTFHRTYMGLVERGKMNVSLENIEKIAIALDVPIGMLFEYGVEKV